MHHFDVRPGWPVQRVCTDTSASSSSSCPRNAKSEPLGSYFWNLVLQTLTAWVPLQQVHNFFQSSFAIAADTWVSPFKKIALHEQHHDVWFTCTVAANPWQHRRHRLQLQRELLPAHDTGWWLPEDPGIWNHSLKCASMSARSWLLRRDHICGLLGQLNSFSKSNQNLRKRISPLWMTSRWLRHRVQLLC